MQQVLYDSLQHKSRVLAGKRLLRAAMTEDGVQVRTQDGDTFYGHILIGADGVHGKVKEEMRRIVSESNPEYSDYKEARRAYILSHGPSLAFWHT